VTLNDQNELIEKVRRLLDDHSLMEAMGRKALKRVDEVFNIRVMTQKYMDIYEACLSR